MEYVWGHQLHCWQQWRLVENVLFQGNRAICCAVVRAVRVECCLQGGEVCIWTLGHCV